MKCSYSTVWQEDPERLGELLDNVALLDRKVDIRLPGKGISNSWREAGPPNHHDDKVDSDQ